MSKSILSTLSREWELPSKTGNSCTGPRGPLDAGGVWDADQRTLADGDWVTVTLTIVGPSDWGEALLADFAPEDV